LNKKKIFRWLKVIALIYATLGIILYYFQDKILFHPVKLDESYTFKFTEPFKEVNIEYDAITTFNIIQFLPKDTTHTKGVVLYFHGNKENINRYAPFADNFTKSGYEVWMADYPTFGKSTGKLSEEILYEEALQVYAMARGRFSKDSIVIYGKSLGTGIASYLASKRNCKQLILETPYKSMTSIFNRYCFIYPVERMIHFKLPSIDYLKNVFAPITIFQGTDDGVVPYSNALQLKESMKKTDEFITIDGAIHTNINDYPLYHQKLDSLLR
jgi:hypothetical protein